ncbi:hypothetical protein K6U06_06295 [Acidiferrimicrobium sp. IK]|uniref:hypothetical protein n=1 Tax=Acidiferrimicrobium sp. IK TaxID=2871700 RepID=UPI0021CB5297|nr:hypothetical protein [Acidiferrimicrobium sp. IK]MCU4183962.1 hypothetical protein [Acidiferrimicrobium sp. IK]
MHDGGVMREDVRCMDELPDPELAAVETARRRERLHADLRAGGSITVEQLAAGRRVTVAWASQLIAEWCPRRQLFVIDGDDQHLVPAFLLDETLSPRPELTAGPPARRPGQRRKLWFTSGNPM